MTLQDEIAETFLEELKASPEVASEVVEALRQLLSNEKKLDADDLIQLFSWRQGEDER